VVVATAGKITRRTHQFVRHRAANEMIEMIVKEIEREKDREKGAGRGGVVEVGGWVISSLPVGRDVEMTEKMVEVGGAHLLVYI